MSKKNKKIPHMVALIPFFATGGWSFPFLFALGPVANPDMKPTSSYPALEQSVEDAHKRELEERAQKIDAYFKERKMPLAGQGSLMVRAAEENDIDWRLLPAISIRESSGGRQMCGYNPFGWASCRISFKNLEESVKTVAFHLGGNHPKTKSYYSGSTEEKLHSYNGTVVPTYTNEVLAIMEKIGRQKAE